MKQMVKEGSATINGHQIDIKKVTPKENNCHGFGGQGGTGCRSKQVYARMVKLLSQEGKKKATQPCRESSRKWEGIYWGRKAG